MSGMLPDLTHLQFAILDALGAIERKGRDLRGRLDEREVSLSAAAFYQAMGRLEEAGLVDGRNTVKVVEGQTLKERRYKTTADGHAARRQSLEFYGHREMKGVPNV